MALANREGSFTGTIYMNKKGPGSFAELGKVVADFTTVYPTAYRFPSLKVF